MPKYIQEMPRVGGTYLIAFNQTQEKQVATAVLQWLGRNQNSQIGNFQVDGKQVGFCLTRLISDEVAGLEAILFNADNSPLLCYLISADLHSQELKIVCKHSNQSFPAELEMQFILHSLWVANQQNTQDSYSPSA